MGTTTKYGLPWPANTAYLKDGAAAIRSLAEAVEAALLPPLLATDGDGALAWGGDKVAEVAWDVTDNPDRKRGSWTSPGSAERLVVPGLPGWYLVSASVVFTGKSEPDTYQLKVTSRQVGSDVGTGTTWGRVQVDVPNTSPDDTVLQVTSLVRIADTTPNTGFAIRASYAGATSPPSTTAGQNKLRAYRLSGL